MRDEHAGGEPGLDRELQLDWDFRPLHSAWPSGPDSAYLMRRVAVVPVEVTAAGASGRLLEVAAAEAVHACRLNLLGLTSIVLEPSPAMLEMARQRMREHGAQLALVRGICETLPFRDASFDRVLCDSAIDHFADPAEGVREMARVLRPGGRLVITANNYAGVAVRVSRALYRAGRLLKLPGAQRHFFWDTPVPAEHTFECTFARLEQLCAPHLDLDHAFGVSLGSMSPGWGALLERLPAAWAQAVLERLDRFAQRHPRAADFIVTVWRPRGDGRVTPRPPVGDAGYVIAPDDLVYPGQAEREAHFATMAFGGDWTAVAAPSQRWTNQGLTGDPSRTWFDDLLQRGPFERAAMLGCDEAGYERRWLATGASQQLDVYELSPGVIATVRGRLGLRRWSAAGRRVRFIRADLNFPRFPAQHYDVIWSTNTLHHVVNLERLFSCVAEALRPGGLFVVHDYIGEPRLQFAAQRLERINHLFAEVPARFRRGDGPLAAPTMDHLSPFCGVRSDAIVPLAEARFEVVHKGIAGRLFPMLLLIDLGALEREEPALYERILAAEADPALQACAAYLVLRRRA